MPPPPPPPLKSPLVPQVQMPLPPGGPPLPPSPPRPQALHVLAHAPPPCALAAVPAAAALACALPAAPPLVAGKLSLSSACSAATESSETRKTSPSMRTVTGVERSACHGTVSVMRAAWPATTWNGRASALRNASGRTDTPFNAPSPAQSEMFSCSRVRAMNEPKCWERSS
eukprot:5936001-Pleurochrysis_carterae.AAC.1